MMSPDDFDDFQSAPPTGAMSPPAVQNTSFQPAGAKPNVFALLNATPTQPAARPPSQPPMGNFSAFSPIAMSNPPMMGSGISPTLAANSNNNNHRPGAMANFGKPMNTPMTAATPVAAKPANSTNFDDLFSFAGLTTGTNSQGMGAGTKPAAPAKVSMAAMAREQSSASIWGGGAAPASMAKPAGGMMGTPMGMNSASAVSAAASDHDDLLL